MIPDVYEKSVSLRADWSARILFALLIVLILILPYAHIPAAKRVVGGALALGTCFYISHQRAWNKLPLFWPWLCWLCWITLSISWASNKFASLEAVWMDGFIPALSFFLCFLLCQHEKRFRQLLQVSLFALLMLCVLAILLKWLGPPGAIYMTQTYPDGWMRYYPGPGRASSYLIAALPLVWAYARYGKREKILASIATFLCALAALYTENRSIWPAIAVMATIIFFYKAELHSRRGKLIALGVFSIALAITLYAVYYLGKSRLNMQGSFGEILSSMLNSDPRPKIWIVWFQHYLQHCLNGWGFGWRLLEASLTSQETKLLYSYNHMVTAHPHNFLLSIATQTGVIGLACLLTVLFTLIGIFVKAWQNGKQEQRFFAACALALIAGFFIRNMTDDFFNDSSLCLFWINIGILVGKSSIILPDNKDECLPT